MTLTKAQVVESVRLDQGESGSELGMAVFQEIKELKSMITALMDRLDEMNLDDLRAMVNSNTREIDELKEVDSTVVPVGEKLDKLFEATKAMAAKVDADATPTTPYTNTFNEQV